MTKNNNPESSTETVVMRRIQRIHLVRTFFTPLVLSSFILMLAAWGIGREVWVSQVFQNMPSAEHIDAVVRFFEMAFINTRFAVQVLVLTVFTAVLLLAYNLVQALRQTLQYR